MIYMAEPATTSVSTFVGGVGIASLLPFIDANALIGAAFGAVVITIFNQSYTKWYLKILSLLLSIVGGYIFGGTLCEIFPIQSSSLSSCGAAVLCVPAVLKLSKWFDGISLSEIIKNRLGGGQG